MKATMHFAAKLGLFFCVAAGTGTVGEVFIFEKKSFDRFRFTDQKFWG
jgi:hypothetical protein